MTATAPWLAFADALRRPRGLGRGIARRRSTSRSERPEGDAARPSAWRRATSRRVARRQVPRWLDDEAESGRRDRAAGAAAGTDWLLRARWPLSAAVVAAHDRHSGTCRRRQRDHRRSARSPIPSVMLAAREAGVTRLLRLGGAHAIAALAFGTATIPRVDKIVGPGKCLRRRREGAGLLATVPSTSSPARARS